MDKPRRHTVFALQFLMLNHITRSSELKDCFMVLPASSEHCYYIFTFEINQWNVWKKKSLLVTQSLSFESQKTTVGIQNKFKNSNNILWCRKLWGIGEQGWLDEGLGPFLKHHETPLGFVLRRDKGADLVRIKLATDTGLLSPVFLPAGISAVLAFSLQVSCPLKTKHSHFLPTVSRCWQGHVKSLIVTWLIYL